MNSHRRPRAIIALALSVGTFTPVLLSQSVFAAAPAPTTTAAPAPSKSTTASAIRNARRAGIFAANQAFTSAILSAQQGRDLARADATASLNQALASAGKDGTARKVAWSAYKSAMAVINTAFNQAHDAAVAARAAAIAALPTN
jgi:hypothetical protein